MSGSHFPIYVSYTHISVRDLYISRIGLSILLQPNMWSDPGNILNHSQTQNVEIRTEAAQFPEKEYINGIFVAVYPESTPRILLTSSNG